MICAKCGHEMNDDMLYCEKCGEEVQFVPDFEPEIEQSISDTLSEIQIQDIEEAVYQEEYYEDEYLTDEYSQDEYIEDEYYEDDSNEYSEEEYYEEYEESDNYSNEEYYEEEYSEDNYEEDSYSEYYDDDEDYEDEEEEFLGDPFDDFEYESLLIKRFFNFLKNSKLKWVILAAILFVVVICIILGRKLANKIYTNNSADYQVQMAAAAAGSGDYATAIEYMEKALSLNSKDSSKKYLLSEYYFANGEDDKAILMLWEIINDNGENANLAYQKMIGYYSERNDYGMIEQILSNCKNQNMIEEYEQFLALAPEFSIPEGIYEDEISVSLNGNMQGTIYYTLDGSEPTTDSDVYFGPITFTDLGIYTITAMFVNPYGIQSEVVRKTYTIDLTTPKAPNVLLDAGSYNIPLLIEVDVQNYSTVYYTTDGTLPTIFSNQYNGPIPMPVGQTHFIFIAINQESVWSEITEVDYTLTLNSSVDINDISNKLLIYDAYMNKTVDTEGHLLGNNTRYTYQVSEAIAYNKDGSQLLLDHGQEGEEDIPDTEKIKDIKTKDIDIYYLIVEYMVDLQDNSMRTGTFYLCNTEDGKIYTAVKDEEGFISIGNEISPEYFILPEVPVDPDNNEGQVLE